MASVLLKIFNKLFVEEKEPNYDSDEGDISVHNESTDDKASELRNADPSRFTRRKGTITSIAKTHGLIDDTLYFAAELLPKSCNILVGDEVYYAAYRASENEVERVCKIDPVDKFDEFGDGQNIGASVGVTANESGRSGGESSNGKDGSVVESRERVLNGIVTRKNGKELVIHPLNISCNLDNINFEFVPIEGDYVSLVAEVSIDPDADNLAGDILHIKHLKPLLVRNGKGAITYLNDPKSFSHKGVIENEIFFSKKFCQIDFTPVFGDQVSYTALESEQGRYKWRALTVTPVSTSPKRRPSPLMRDATQTKSELGIVITGKTDFGPLEMDETEELTLEVKNLRATSQVLCRTSFSSPKSQSQISVKSPGHRDAIVLEPNESVKFVFKCRARFLGASTELVVFHFKDFKVGRRFNVNVTVGKEIREIIDSGGGGGGRGDGDGNVREKTYLWRNFDVTDALFGAKPMVTTRFMRCSVKKYTIPEKLFKIVLGEADAFDGYRNLTVEDFAPYLREELSYSNYFDKFHTLIHLEEINCRLAYRKYDLQSVTLKRKGQYLSLDVSAIPDGATKFIVGTTVIVTQPWSEVNTGKQVGYVHESRDGEIFVKFHESFHASYDESDCDVSFQPSRTTFVRCHVAVDAATRLGPSWLFPKGVAEKEPLVRLEPEADDLSLAEFSCDIDENGYTVMRDRGRAHSVSWFNGDLNDLQRAAVANVLEGRGRPLPYIIFGPPGTGKTVTVVEIILQVYHMFSDSRILIGTPSNSAANIICQHLAESGRFTPGEMVRLLSLTRAVSGDISEDIVPFCATVHDSTTIASKSMTLQNIRHCRVTEAIGTQRIVIGTCSTLGNLHTANLHECHFSHVIIDEAAQATEPLALIPITFADPKRGQVILAGDTEQLGPVCLESKCIRFGYTKSLMERFIKTTPYLRSRENFPETNGFDPRCISKLLVNYRSVPEILTLPSKLFYDSELIPTVSQVDGLEADMIRRFAFESDRRSTPPALIFHGLRGQNYREENGYSWYNPFEIWQVVRYLKRLYSIDMTPDLIGVITPYTQQVMKLRLLLSALDIPAPKIGSVDEFQGQERYVIILSAVRSSIHPGDTTEDPLGFVATPRRLNVAITRARAILIIVGNPFTLSLDPYWSSVIQYCVGNGSYTGCAFDAAQN